MATKTETKLIPINTASLEALQTIESIGKVLAERIVAGRPYSSWEGVGAIKGVGDATLGHLKKAAVIDAVSGSAASSAGSAGAAGTPSKQQQAATTPASAAKEENLKEKPAKTEIRVASFNVRNLSKNRDPKHLAKLAAIVGMFDIVAVQEVRDLEVLQMLVDLIPGYTFAASPLTGPTGVARKEIYAFVWNSKRVSKIGETSWLEQKEEKLVRNPFCGYFKAAKFDFVLCTTHAVWGDSQSDRRKEIAELGRVLATVATGSTKEKDVILLGDFNMIPTDKSWESLDKQWKALIQAPLKTTVGDVSLFDNIWINASATSEWTGKAGVHAFDKEYEDSQQGRRAAMNEISDHRPVYAVFRCLKKDDDEKVDIAFAEMKI